jgi:hypothetical protein
MGFLDDLAQAWQRKERMRLGIPQEERAQEAHDLQTQIQRRELEMSEAEAPIRAAERQARTQVALANAEKAKADAGYQAGRNETLIEIAKIRAAASREVDPTKRAELEARAERLRAAAALDVARAENPGMFRASPAERTSAMWVLGPNGPEMRNRYSPGEGAIPGTENLKPPLTGSERESFGLLGQVDMAISDMKTALQKIPAESMSRGPVAGPLSRMYREKIDASGPAGDFDVARTRSRTLIYALSGKQLNQFEQQWVETILPSLSNYGVASQIVRYERFMRALKAAKEKGFEDPFSVAVLAAESGGDSGGDGNTPPPPPPPAGGGGPQYRFVNGKLVKVGG